MSVPRAALTSVIPARKRPGRRLRLIDIALASCAVLLLAGPSNALEIRSADEGTLTVPAGEFIDDTLIALGDTVEIDGEVAGDLIVFGRSVVIRGRVDGMIVTGAQSVSISGEIGGSVIGAGQSLNLSSAMIGRNLFGFGNIVNAAESARVGQNAVVFSGQAANLAGPVGRDVVSFGTQLEIGNSIGGDVKAYGPAISILGLARIAGDLEAHVPNADGVSISPGAIIQGEQNIDVRVSATPQNRYATGGFYGGQLLRLLVAFVTGLVILSLIPGLRGAAITSVGNGLLTAGIGLVTLVSVPIIALLMLFTVIGVPLSLMSVMLYLSALYLAKIVLSYFVAQQIYSRTGPARHYALTLATGLVIMIVVVNLPFIGGVLNFLLTITGLGLIAVFGWGTIRKSPAPEAG